MYSEDWSGERSSKEFGEYLIEFKFLTQNSRFKKDFAIYFLATIINSGDNLKNFANI